MPRVISQRQTTIIAEDGTLQQVMAVTAKSDKGVVFTVDVPLDSYSRASIEQAINDRASAIDDVHGIGNA